MKLYIGILSLIGYLALIQSPVVGGSVEEEESYRSMCTSKRNGDVSLNSTRNSCMCGFLADAKAAETQLRSVRQQRSVCQKGFVSTADQDYPCSNVDLMSFLSLSELNSIYGRSSDKVSDVWGWTDGSSCTEIAILGMESGTAFIDVTNSESPTYLGKLPVHDANSYWRDMKTYKDYAFIVSESEGHGMQVVNLLNLIGMEGAVLEETSHYRNFGNAHNIFINEETAFAYVVGSNQCEGGLNMIDISNPESCHFAGCYADDGYTHDVQCVVYKGSDRLYRGREICFACNENAVTIVDVTNKRNPVRLSRTQYTDTGYTHQGWLTEDHDTFIFGDEIDERNENVNTRTLVLRTTNLRSPKLGGSHYSALRAVDHNQYVHGKQLYQSNYQAGLRILDINDASTANFSEVGFFDLYPSSDEAGFNGAWSNYPFFGSGTILASGVEEGLFVLKSTVPVVGTCPYVDTCDGTTGVQRVGNVFSRTKYSACGPDIRDKYWMRKTILGILCIDSCVMNLLIGTKQQLGWECGKC